MFIDDIIGVQCSANIQRTMARWTSEIWWHWRWVKQTIIVITILRLYYITYMKAPFMPSNPLLIQTTKNTFILYYVKKSVKWTLFLIHNLFSCNAVTDISYRIFYVWTLTRKQKSFFATKKGKIKIRRKENLWKTFPWVFISSHLHFEEGKTIIYITLFLLFLVFFGGQKNRTSHKLKASAD